MVVLLSAGAWPGGTIDDKKVHISRMFIHNSGATKVSCLGGGYFVMIVLAGCITLGICGWR
jgi:hypothetical protein